MSPAHVGPWPGPEAGPASPPEAGVETVTPVVLTVTPATLPSYCLLAGSGFCVRTRLGCSVRALLCGRLGIEPEYLERRIQTIFLNGMVVDDPDTAVVTAGATLALSAAMPGIAGAVLRKNSRCAPMRSVLSYRLAADESALHHEGVVVIRLFNLLQPELGPRLLAEGIQISAQALHDLLQDRWEAFRSGILDATVSGQSASPEVLLRLTESSRQLTLIVRAGGNPAAAQEP